VRKQSNIKLLKSRSFSQIQSMIMTVVISTPTYRERIGEQLHEPIKQARENTDGKENQEWLVIGGKTTKFAPIG